MKWSFFLFFSLGAAYSQWTLEELISWAEKKNINLRISANNLSISRLSVLQTNGNFLPTLNLGASHTYNYGKTIDRFTNTFANRNVLSQNFFISSNWILFNGFSRYYQRKSARYSFLSAEANLRNALLDLRLNVSTAYLNVLLAQENLKIAKLQKELTEYQLKRMEGMLEAGSVSKSSYADLKAQLENEKVNLVNAENNYQLQILTLRQLCGLDTVKNFSLQAPDLKYEAVKFEKFLNVPTQDIFLKIEKSYPSLQSAEYSLRGAEAEWKYSTGAKFPTLSLNGAVGTGYSGLATEITGYTYAGSDAVGYTSGGQIVYVPRLEYQTRVKPFFDQYKDNVNKSFGITLTVPILNNLQAHTASAQSRIRMENSRLNLELARQNLFRTIEQNLLQFRAAYARYSSAQASEEASGLSFRLNEERLQNGVGNMQEYLQAKNRYQAAMIQKNQAFYEAVFRMKILEIMMEYR